MKTVPLLPPQALLAVGPSEEKLEKAAGQGLVLAANCSEGESGEGGTAPRSPEAGQSLWPPPPPPLSPPPRQ